MSSLINRLQRALLGSAGPEKVKALLTELQIPAGGSGGNIREVRRGVLRPISDEAILRDALAGMGITGGGGNAVQGLSNIRNAVLHNVVEPETQLLAGLNDLLEPGDLAGGGGPEWVPAGAKIHIDFLGGTPQGRAWVDGSGEVGIETLSSSFNPNYFVPGEGYNGGTRFEYAGDALAAVLGSFTCRILYFWPEGIVQTFLDDAFLVKEPTGSYALQLSLDFPNQQALGQGYNEISLTMNPAPLNDGAEADAYNCVALTLTTVAEGGRFEFAVNGSTVTGGVYDTDDRPVSDPFTLAWTHMEAMSIQSITIYDPLPDTTGLSDLSEP